MAYGLTNHRYVVGDEQDDLLMDGELRSVVAHISFNILLPLTHLGFLCLLLSYL